MFVFLILAICLCLGIRNTAQAGLQLKRLINAIPSRTIPAIYGSKKTLVIEISLKMNKAKISGAGFLVILLE